MGLVAAITLQGKPSHYPALIMRNYMMMSHNLTILEMKKLSDTLTTPVGADMPEAVWGVSSLIALTAR